LYIRYCKISSKCGEFFVYSTAHNFKIDILFQEKREKQKEKGKKGKNKKGNSSSPTSSDSDSDDDEGDIDDNVPVDEDSDDSDSEGSGASDRENDDFFETPKSKPGKRVHGKVGFFSFTIKHRFSGVILLFSKCQNN
jgi:hypothetical protein